MVDERPPDANHEVRRPVDLARHGHRRGDVSEDESDQIHVNVSVTFRYTCWTEGHLRKYFFHGENTRSTAIEH